jgi:pimeloyl-ACP methyl ester carboxylesterase
MPFLDYKEKKISYTDEGTGHCIVLLHGYTESLKIWKKFDEVLSRTFRVITIDLPGFGKSECVAEVHTMELMADVVCEVLRSVKVAHCLMTGHSMGGFVTLAFARKYPEMLLGICLFHSHPFEDTPEGKVNRERTIGILKENRQNYIFQFIPSLFAPEMRERHAAAIEKLVKQASEITIESLIAATEGMKLRPDSSELLKTLEIPVFFIVGMKDSRAPLDRIGEMLLLPKHSESLILKDIGHMGYIEAFRETLPALWCFAKKVLGK